MIVALDLETTWLNSQEDKIIEVALVKFDEKTGEVLDTFSSLVDPEIEIPELSSSITWIFDEDVKNAPKFSEIAEKIDNFIGDLPILWHNIEFDYSFLVANWIWIEKNIKLDTFFLANFIAPREKTLSLETLSEYYSISQDNAHRALDDTLATKDLFLKLKAEFDNFSNEKRDAVSFILEKSNDANIPLIKDFLGLKIVKNLKDVMNSLNSKLSENKINNLEFDEEIEYKSDKIFSFDYFSWYENFEERSNQKLMWEIVWNSLLENNKTLIEAPTGVWKTFAYLLPSIIFSVKTWERVVISTNTKALQDQIFYKDLDFLSKIDVNFSYCKLKWKSNYIGLLPFFNYLDDSIDLSFWEVSFLSKVFIWLFDTKTWELDELNFYPLEYRILREINADNYLTLRDENPHRNREFLYKARMNAQKSNVVVVNHSLLIQDAKSDNSIIWEYKHLVVDESHNLEDTSSDALRKTFHLSMIEDTFGVIEKNLKKNKAIVDSYNELKEDILYNLSSLFDFFHSYLEHRIPNIHNQKYIHSLLEADFYEDFVKNFETMRQNINFNFSKLIDRFNLLDDDTYVSISKEVDIFEEFLDSLSTMSTSVSTQKYIIIVWKNDRIWVNFSLTELKPWDFLQKSLWTKLDSVILTSATLKVDNNFDYVHSVLSLWDFESHSLDSDFDYSKQALLFIPDDMGSIKNNSHIVHDFFDKFLRITRWKTLVLCTSFNSIKESYLHLSNSLRWEKINIYAQNIGWGKHKLLDAFKKNSSNSALFWTDTFWEGVDIPWSDLEYLIIHKFPFDVPTDPVFIARNRLYKDWFKEYAIPRTILKLKQGFGRLIRTKKDKWIVILLDNRIISSWWWKRLYSAFPEDINTKIWWKDQFIELLQKKKEG